MSSDGEAADDSVAPLREVHFYQYVDELGLVDTAAGMGGTATGEARGRGWQCGRRCARMAEEARSTLRGRRLFTLFAVVNLVNYLDRGVSAVYTRYRVYEVEGRRTNVVDLAKASRTSAAVCCLQ